MTTLKFNLKEPNGKSETLIYLFITVNGQRIKKSTHQKIHPELWDSKKKRVASNSRIILKHKRITPGIELRIRRIQESLDFLSKEVERFFTQMKIDDQSVTKENLNTFLNELLSPEQEVNSHPTTDIISMQHPVKSLKQMG